MFRLLLIDDSLDGRTLIVRELRREFPDLQIKEVIDAQGFNALNTGDFGIVITDYYLSIWDWNSQTNQITWSNNYELLFGYAPGTFARTYEAVSICVHPEEREVVASALTRSLKQRVEYDAEFRLVCPDGSIR